MSATPQSIETHYRQAFKAGLESAFQQFDSKLMQHVQIVRQDGEFDFYDRIGIAEEMQVNSTRYGDNPHTEIEHQRRRIGIVEYDNGKMIDPKDIARVANDPTNEYNRAFIASGHRKLDDIIVDGWFGNAYIGKKGETVVSFVGENSGKVTVGNLSKGNTRPITTAGRYVVQAGSCEGICVAHDYVATGNAADSGLTLAKLKAVRSTMLKLESITMEEMLNCFITERQFEDLLNIEEVINADYTVRKNLAEGNVTEFMGFRFIHTERLPADASGNRRCVVAPSASLKLAVGKELKADMWRLPDKKNIPYLYFAMSAGASRMWGELTAEVKCVEA